MHNYIFITGSPRSGTTLLEKILHNHKDICIGSQPFPFLFYKAKEEFFKDYGISGREIPLGHLFLEDAYSPDEFLDYLTEHIFSAEDIVDAFNRMEGYSGHKTPGLQKYRERVQAGTFIEIYKQLTGFIAELYNKTEAYYMGAKEAFCEEFIPYFLRNNVKVLVIIRDPRDVLTSVQFGRGGYFAGYGLPVLYTLRIWRKSVAFALAYRNDPCFKYLRYEDLATNTKEVLNQLTDFMELKSFPDSQFDRGVLDQEGHLWKANSSFNPYEFISVNSIGKFMDVLPLKTIKFIENICRPELVAMGYEMYASHGDFDEHIIKDFDESNLGIRKGFAENYSTNKEHKSQEVRRFKMLFMDVGQLEKRRWFVLPEAYDRLKKSLLAKNSARADRR
jgi:Sulfotransferase family